MIRWALTSSPRGFVVSSIVRITSICPLPKMLPDYALGGEDEASEFEIAGMQLIQHAPAQGTDIGWGEILFL